MDVTLILNISLQLYYVMDAKIFVHLKIKHVSQWQNNIPMISIISTFSALLAMHIVILLAGVILVQKIVNRAKFLLFEQQIQVEK